MLLAPRIRYESDILGVSLSYLSAIELGNKNVPKNFVPTLIDKLQIPSSEYAQLVDLADRSTNLVKFDLRGSSDQERQLVALFAQRYSKVSEENRSRILELLEN